MAGGFDEKAGGAQMGVMQGPMVSQIRYDPLQVFFFSIISYSAQFPLCGHRSNSNIDPSLTSFSPETSNHYKLQE